MTTLSPTLQTCLLLFASNIFMTLAWYWHLSSLRTAPLVVAIVVSWMIALAEYALQVPANRIGYGVMTLAQLKITQEIITMTVFAGYATPVGGRGAALELRGGGAVLGRGGGLHLSLLIGARVGRRLEGGEETRGVGDDLARIDGGAGIEGARAPGRAAAGIAGEARAGGRRQWTTVVRRGRTVCDAEP